MRTVRTSFPFSPLPLALALVACLASPMGAAAQQSNKHGAFRTFLEGLAAAAASADGGAIIGQWRGAKTENDPLHGGYLNIDFAFSFTADGRYQEAAYMGSRQVMFAQGTYELAPGHTAEDPSFTNVLAFHPMECQFAGNDFAQIVKFFPIPNEQNAQMYVGFSSGGSYVTLKELSMGRMGESWGMRAAR